MPLERRITLKRFSAMTTSKRLPDSELLKEGCRSYHTALFAVMQFRREAEEAIRAVVDERIDDIAAALQLDKSELSAGLRSYTDPANLVQNWDGSEASVGLKYPARDYDARWGIYFLFWIGNGEEACAYASCWFRDPLLPIGKLASLEIAGLETDKSSAWISKPLSEDTDGLTGAINRALDIWIDVWRKVGGIQQFLPVPGIRPRTGA
jgi:hypothetical protein